MADERTLSLTEVGLGQIQRLLDIVVAFSRTHATETDAMEQYRLVRNVHLQIGDLAREFWPKFESSWKQDIVGNGANEKTRVAWDRVAEQFLLLERGNAFLETLDTRDPAQGEDAPPPLWTLDLTAEAERMHRTVALPIQQSTLAEMAKNQSQRRDLGLPAI